MEYSKVYAESWRISEVPKEMRAMTIAVDPTKAESPYDYLSEDYAHVLHVMLGLVPKAKEMFDEGRVPAALDELRGAKHVHLNPSTGMTKEHFLSMVGLAMPNKYSI